MKNKKGFTLIELLAVIVILGIIMSIAGMSVMNTRKKSDEETAKKLEKSITDLGPEIYTYEMAQPNSFFKKQTNTFKISLEELKEAGYLKTKTLKIGNVTCNGYLEVDMENVTFSGKIKCGDIYTTNGYESGTFTSAKLTN